MGYRYLVGVSVCEVVSGQHGTALGHAIGPEIVSQGVQTVGVDLTGYGLNVHIQYVATRGWASVC